MKNVSVLEETDFCRSIDLTGEESEATPHAGPALCVNQGPVEMRRSSRIIPSNAMIQVTAAHIKTIEDKNPPTLVAEYILFTDKLCMYLADGRVQRQPCPYRQGVFEKKTSFKP